MSPHQLRGNQWKPGSQSMPLISPRPAPTTLEIMHYSLCGAAWHGAACLMNSPLMNFDDRCKWREHHGENRERGGSDNTWLLSKIRRFHYLYVIYNHWRRRETKKGRCFRVSHHFFFLLSAYPLYCVWSKWASSSSSASSSGSLEANRNSLGAASCWHPPLPSG